MRKFDSFGYPSKSGRCTWENEDEITEPVNTIT